MSKDEGFEFELEDGRRGRGPDGERSRDGRRVQLRPACADDPERPCRGAGRGRSERQPGVGRERSGDSIDRPRPGPAVKRGGRGGGRGEAGEEKDPDRGRRVDRPDRGPDVVVGQDVRGRLPGQGPAARPVLRHSDAVAPTAPEERRRRRLADDDHGPLRGNGRARRGGEQRRDGREGGNQREGSAVGGRWTEQVGFLVRAANVDGAAAHRP